MNIEQIFEDTGGSFINAYPWFVTKASRIKAVILDWDGVFNGGAKGEGMSSLYTEVDSMGLNLLRLAYWLNNKHIPFLGIITGQNNKSAIELATREHFHAVYGGFLNKELAFNHLLEQNHFEANQVAYIFDDVLDLGIADKCGLRIQVRNGGSPLFDKFIVDNSLADYLTGNKGSNYAVREACELLVGILGNYNEAVKERVAFGELYQEYLSQRNAIETNFFAIQNDNNIIKTAS